MEKVKNVVIDIDNYHVMDAMSKHFKISHKEALTKLIDIGFSNIITNGLPSNHKGASAYRKDVQGVLDSPEMKRFSEYTRDIWTFPTGEVGKVVEF